MASRILDLRHQGDQVMAAKGLLIKLLIEDLLKETLSSTAFVNCAGLCAVVFPPLNIFVLSSVPAGNLYYIYLDNKNPLRKYYSQYTGLSFENMQLKTVFAAHLQSTLL